MYSTKRRKKAKTGSVRIRSGNNRLQLVFSFGGMAIETCRVSNHKGWRQAMWKSSHPIFTPRRRQGDSESLCKTRYIGKAGGPQHQQALGAIARRKQLTQIQNQIAQVEVDMRWSKVGRRPSFGD